jgi:hypothetical protein
MSKSMSVAAQIDAHDDRGRAVRGKGTGATLPAGSGALGQSLAATNRGLTDVVVLGIGNAFEAAGGLWLASVRGGEGPIRVSRARPPQPPPGPDAAPHAQRGSATPVIAPVVRSIVITFRRAK